MFFIKTETREMKIENENGEKYFDAILQMMLDERKKPEGRDASVSAVPSGTVRIPLESDLNPERKESEGGYRGFLHLKCSRCGRIKTFCAKETIKKHRCCDCDKETELGEMRKAYTTCKCGQESYYLTNRTDTVLEIACANCGAAVSVMWNPNKGCYETIKG